MAAGRTHAWFEELLGAHALDALPPDEAELLEHHLETCPRCRDELSGHREVAALLAYSGTPAPPGLWDQLARELTAPPAPLHVPSLPSLGDGTDGGPIPIDRARRARHRPGFRAGIAASVAALAIGGVAGLAVVNGSARDAQHRVDQANAKIAELQEREARRTAAARAAAEPGARSLQVADQSGRVLADIVVSQGGEAFVLPKALNPLPDGKVYQLWAEVGGLPVSLGAIGRDPGTAVRTMRLPAGSTGLALSVENAPEAATPTRSAISWVGQLPPVAPGR